MNIRHHPEDELLLALAAGSLPGGEALLVTVHLDGCAHCRARLHTLQALGGVLLDAAAGEPLAPDALARTLATIDSSPRVPPAATAALAARAVPAVTPALAAPELPGGLPWPASLAGCSATRWRWMGPGMHWSRVRMPCASEGNLFLLRIAPGRSLPRHTHSGLELTQVLCGSFDDGRAVFGPGDFDAADADVHHQPVVQAGGVCVCLAYVGGPLRFDGRLAALIGGWVGM